MTDLRQAAQQALEALKGINKLSVGENAICLPAEIDDAMDALRTALAEPQDPVAYNGWVLREVLFDNGEPVGHREPAKADQQEPFGYFRAEPFGWTDCAETDDGAVALYTAPPQRKPLTDEEIDRVTDQQWATNNHKPIYAAHRAYARAIERAHGIGGSNG